jgi:SAM-dependent methyltransferase
MERAGISRVKVIASLVGLLFLWFFLCGFCYSQNQERDAWQQPDKILKVLGIKEGMQVGDAGAGEGYFVFKLASKVGEKGHVYANDINWRSLQTLKKRAKEKGLANVTTILGKANDPLFPEGQLDLILMVHVIHYLDRPKEFFENLKRGLKPGGNFALVQWDRIKMGAPKGTENLPEREEIIKTVQSAGFELVREETFLEKDNIYLFKVNKKIDKGEKNEQKKFNRGAAFTDDTSASLRKAAGYKG